MVKKRKAPWYSWAVEPFQRWRSRYLGPLVRPLLKLGVSANYLTIVGFISGLIAVWFLFRRNDLFILFASLQIIFDIIDGVLARETKATRLGKYLDHGIDNLMVVLIVGKGFFVLASVQSKILSGVVAVLYAFHLGAYLLSKLRAPFIFLRTMTFVFYFLGFYKLGAFVIGLLTVYGLGLQLRYHFTGLRRKK